MGDNQFSDADGRHPAFRVSSGFSPKAVRRGALLTTALVMSLAGSAEAQLFWPAGRDEPVRVERKPVRVMRQRAPKMAEAAKDVQKPVGPVVIAVSIEKQQLKIYDSNGLFAESPVSTGMPGHSTPMGVFSVIGKEVFHRSNIYSGAPMPYMQRITWSGVAMHAGVLPGYPASHGCIRLPASFATRLFGWTKMGARVVIAPGELSPADFAHPRLLAKKSDAPDPNMPVASAPTQKDASAPPATTPKADKSAVADAGSVSLAELRLTTASGKGEEIKTADASGAVPSAPDAADSKTDKDQARPTDPGKATDSQPADTKPAPRPLPGTAEFIGPVKPRSGQIAAFVSRKENKLYVRQNFEPLFDVPVTIAASDRPLGTHVFTVRADKDDADALHWSVISLPPRPAKRAEEDSSRRRGKKASAAPMQTAVALPPSTAAEALDRITIPDEAMKRIGAALTPGGSIVVSDQGLGDETGSGTDFIVPLR